jgi:IclR family acetate operon transcriptional repressor
VDRVRESDRNPPEQTKSGNGGPSAKVRTQSDTGTLGKAVSVLDIVASADEPMRFTDILALSDQPRGTLHRQLSNLVEEGLLSLNRDHSYSLGLRLLKFAARAWAGNQFRTIAEPHLRALHNRTGETVHLGVLRGTEVIYLDKVESRQAVRMYSQIGNASPVFCTGVGKAALSALDDEALSEVIGKISFRRFTDHTLVTPEALRVEIRDIRASGNAYDREEHELGIRCVAAPIFTPDRSFVAGVSVTGPAYRVSMEALQSWAGLVRETAGAIMDDMAPRLGPRP